VVLVLLYYALVLVLLYYALVLLVQRLDGTVLLWIRRLV